MRMLVTGGGGFLGLYIVEQLIQAGHDVRVFCRNRYEALDTLKVETVCADLQDADAVSRSCVNVDAVFHVAAVPGVWGKWQTFHGINTIGTENVIRACRQHQVRRLIYTSSPSVVFDGHDHINADESLPYPTEWLCHYPHSKALAEQAVLAANGPDLKTVSLRPHLIWGQRDNHLIPRLIQRARSGRLRKVGDGTNQVSAANVENAATAHLQAEIALRSSDSAAAGRAYFINDPDPVNLWEWVDQILALAGLPAVKKSISAKAAYRFGAGLEGIWKTLRLTSEPPMTRFVAQQLAGHHSYSIQAARRDFNYDPQVTFQQGMEKLAEDLQA